MDETTDEDWARRVQRLGAEERERRRQTVDALLADTEAISGGLESELRLLRERLTGQAGADGPGGPGISGPATMGEQLAVAAGRAGRERCLCGEAHDDCTGIPPAVAGRMRAYLAAHPGRQFAHDDSGTVAVIIPHGAGAPEIIAAADDLTELLDLAGAPPAAELS